MEQEKAIIDLIISQFEGKIQQVTVLFENLKNAALTPVAPGRNKVVHLLGHLLVVHDRLFEGLAVGERMYPKWDNLFLSAQRDDTIYPDYQELLASWQQVNTALIPSLLELSVMDWLSAHAYVSDIDFAREPHRNKLNLLLSRNGHLFHHGGQLALVMP